MRIFLAIHERDAADMAKALADLRDKMWGGSDGWPGTLASS
jgi:hypothetical protein